MIRFVTLALTGVFLVLASPSLADSYVELKCTDYDCKFKKKLKPLQTHEYRGRCNQDGWGYRLPDRQNCKSDNKAISCTGTKASDAMIGVVGYSSCSCTNWDVTKNHDATIVIVCRKRGSDLETDDGN